MPTFIFTMKQYLHLHLLWSRTIICLCNEAALALFFCHQAALALRPHLHFLHTETMPTFIFAMKPWQHFTLALALVLKSYHHLHWSCANSCLCREAMTTLHSHQSRSKVHLYHEATSTLHSYQSRANIHLCHEATSTLHSHQIRANIYEATSKLHLN